MIYWRAIDKTLLEPEFVNDLEALLMPDPASWYVTWGKRSSETQADLYKAYVAGGPRAAPPGFSPHEFGLAVDLALDGDPATPRLQPDYVTSHSDWLRLRALVDAHPRLHGGWHFGDNDHVEKTKWNDYKGWTA